MRDKPIDNYIARFPVGTQEVLREVRETVVKAAPDAEEAMSYGIPTFKLNGKALVHFAAYKNHIGFYATPSGHQEFSNELSQYKQGKGSVQFPLDQPMPLDLIQRIVLFRRTEIHKIKQ
ncbi:MAG: DUF1801 domain-containing protein [Cyclobacteriaceae bacterium]